MASSILSSLILLIKTKGDTSGLDKTDKAIKKTTTSLQKMSKSTGMLGSLSNKLFRGFNLSSLWNGAMGYVQFEKDLGAIHSRFYALTQDHKQASEEFDYIRNVAKDTAMDIKKTADSYSIFYASTRKTLGKEGARGVFEDWTRVSRVLHLSEHQFERVTYALREMASKGAIYSQDLRMQIGTHVPNAMGLAQKAAEQMGFTGVDWFEKLQKAAKGNTKITTEFVRLFSKEARKAYGSEQAFREAMKQPDALAQTIKNTAFDIGYNFSKAGGGYMVVKILEGIRDTIAKIPFDKITNVLGSIAKGMANIFSFLTNNIKIIVFLLQTMLAYNLAYKIGSIFKTIGLLVSGKGINKFALRNLLKNPKGLFQSALASALTTGYLKGSARLGIKTVAGRLLTFMGGPWGLALGVIISFMPQILGFVRKLWEHTPWGKKERSAYFGGTGYKTEDIVNTLYHINKNNMLKNPQNLESLLRTYGIQDLQPYIYVDTKNDNKIEVYLDGEKLDIETKYRTFNNTETTSKLPPKPVASRTAYDIKMGK